MQWMVLVPAAVILFVLILKTRRSSTPELDFVPENEPAAPLAVTARQAEGRGFLRFHPKRRLLTEVEKPLAFLLSLPDEERLPAAQSLCANARFLQEEANSVILCSRTLPALPATPSRVPRVYLFAHELIRLRKAHLTPETLEEAMMTWQNVLPFDHEELLALPIILRAALLKRLCMLSQECARDQRARQAALRVQSLYRHGRPRQAEKMLKRFGKQRAFLERLSRLHAAEEWMEEAIQQKETSIKELIREEQSAQIELSLWIDNILATLRLLNHMPWDHLLEEWSHIHALLTKDVVYTKMDTESRRLYRACCARIARRAGLREMTVASAVLALCANAKQDSVETHAGYYLMDDGIPALLNRLQSMRFSDRLLYSGGLLRQRFRPSSLPRIRLDRLTADTQTLVVCPAVLTSASQAIQMVKKLSVCHEANPEKHLHFLLLGDFQDSLSATLTTDGEIISAASSAIRALCAETGHPFFYLQRERVYTIEEKRHHSRERRRGSIHTLLALICGNTVKDSFACATFDPSSFKGRYRYVIILDDDTFLPPGAPLQLVGAMLHPLNRRQKHDHRMRGFSVIQPRMEVAAHTVITMLGALLPNQNMRRHWLGCGIVDPAAFANAVQYNVPEAAIPAHALLEGELAGCACCSDIVLYETRPQTLRAYLNDLHQRTRGEWQLLGFLVPFVPRRHRPERHMLSLNGRIRIWRRLLGSLVAPIRLVLLAFAAGSGRIWLFASVLLLPELAHPYALRKHLVQLAVLPCQAFVQTDAIIRAMYRLFVSHQHLLSQPFHTFYEKSLLYVSVSAVSAGFFALLCLLPGSSGLCCLAAAVGWMLFAFAFPLLEQERTQEQHPTGYMTEVLMRIAKNTLLFFETAITDEDHALPPNHVQIDPNKGIAHHTSPSAIGLYLCSLIAAEKLGLLNEKEMFSRTEAAFASLEALPKWHGLPFSRYDTRTLAAHQPAFVASDGCGMLAVCLLTCAQGLRSMLDELGSDALTLAARMDGMVFGMQLDLLYDPDAELFRTGMNAETGMGSSAHYDLLAGESQLLSFAAVTLGKVPIRHWEKLSRTTARSRALISYSGGLQEYVAPLLFQMPIKGTLLQVSAHAALRAQKRVRFKGAFGVGQSACYAFDTDLNYLSKPFGIPQLALMSEAEGRVVAPYTSMLSMPLDLKAAFRNLRRLQILGMEGPLGLFESVDFDPSRVEGQPCQIIRSHTAHHQAMILCAICNALQGNWIARLFSSLPRVQAYQPLLEEPPARMHSLIRHPFHLSSAVQSATTEQMHRIARPLHFPVDAHLLCGGGTTCIIDAQGGGYLKHQDIMMTRFDENCCIPGGMRFYLRDSQSGAFWMTADPYLLKSVQYTSSQAVFTHARFDVNCEMRLWINPLDGSVIHCLSLQNQTAVQRVMEVCSYLEPALAPFGEEHASIRTERLGRHGICATREQDGLRLWHLLKTESDVSMFRLQSDRTVFLGRGRSFHAPKALEHPISAVADMLGDMCDPCLSVRAQFTLPAGGTRTFFFVTHLADGHENASAFCERYSDPDVILHTHASALTRAMISAKQAGLTTYEQALLSRMTGTVVYTSQPFQGGETVLPATAAEHFGISAETPTVLLECSGGVNRTLLGLLLRGRSWFAQNGLNYDLLLVVQGRRKMHSLLAQIEEIAKEHGCYGSEGIRVIPLPDPQEMELLRSCARLVLNGAASLEDQLSALMQNVYARPQFFCRPPTQWKAHLPPAADVLLFNGFGGFTPDEGHYQITLSPGLQTPAPWCNTLASHGFVTMAGESGQLFTRAGQACGTENFYMRDTEHHVLWSLTRQPLGHGMPVRITHGFGETRYECSAYGLYGRIECFTDPDETMGVRIMQIKNEDDVERHLVFTHTCTFNSLSCLRAQSSHAVGWDPQSGNCVWLGTIDPDEWDCAAMSAGLFQGLWSNAPYALSCFEQLKGGTGNTAVISCMLHLQPGESRTLITAAGFQQSHEDIERCAELLRREGASARLLMVRKHWGDLLGQLEFDLPDPALSLMMNRWLPYQALTEFYRTDLADDLSALQETLLQRFWNLFGSISYGAHDLPLADGKENAWLGMLLCEAIQKFAPLYDTEAAQFILSRRENLLAALKRADLQQHECESRKPDILTGCLAVLALQRQGENERAWDMALRMLPTSHTATRQLAARYRNEPYKLAECSALFFSIVLKDLLGFHKSGSQLRFRPVVPARWETLRITYRCGSTTYHLHASRRQGIATADGMPLPDGVLTLEDDGRIHEAFFPLQ